MPIAYVKLCPWCNIIKDGNKRLDKRISRSSLYMPGGDSLASIHADYAKVASVKSFRNHAAKHHTGIDQDLKQKIKRNKIAIAHRKVTEAVEAETQQREVIQFQGHTEARKALLQRGMEALEQGDLKMTMSAIVQLLGQEQKAEENAKDRSLDAMKMYAYFASNAGAKGAPSPYMAIDADKVNIDNE